MYPWPYSSVVRAPGIDLGGLGFNSLSGHITFNSIVVVLTVHNVTLWEAIKKPPQWQISEWQCKKRLGPLIISRLAIWLNIWYPSCFYRDIWSHQPKFHILLTLSVNASLLALGSCGAIMLLKLSEQWNTLAWSTWSLTAANHCKFHLFNVILETYTLVSIHCKKSHLFLTNMPSLLSNG